MTKKTTSVLDQINTNPVYSAILPSTGKKFRFRGYSAGEEQALLVAKESKDITMIIDNVKQIIKACTFDEIDPDKIAAFDVEYLLLIMRSKSVGEEIEVSLVCQNEACKKINDTMIDIKNIAAPVVTPDANVIHLNDNVSIIMQYPGFDVLEQMTAEDGDTFAVISGLFLQIINGQKVIEVSELDPAEVIRFTKAMNSKSIKKLHDFILEAPAVRHEHKLKCIHCGNDNVYDFKGLNNFFG